MRRFDAVVLGAGPAGSSAAYFLAQSGLRVAIVEKSEFPREKVCGEFVSATTFPVLDSMGIGEALRRSGGPPTRRAGLYGGDATFFAPMPVAKGGEGWGRTLARAVLDPSLLEAARAQGAEVFQPWKAVAMDRVEEGHLVTIESRGQIERLSASVVVVAHGSWEIGPLPTQPQRSNAPGDVLAFKAFYHGASFDDDLMILAGFPGGYGGMVHRDRSTVGLSLCVRRDVLRASRERYGLPSAWENLVRHAVETTRGIAEAIAGAKLESAPRAAGPLRPGVRTLYEDGVFRVGNAAGEAHPTVAEGISMAIQSGMLLAGHLVGPSGALDDPGALDAAGRAYSRAWKEQFGGRIRIADVYARMCMSPVACALLTPLFTIAPQLITFGAVLSGKTKFLSAMPKTCNRVS